MRAHPGAAKACGGQAEAVGPAQDARPTCVGCQTCVADVRIHANLRGRRPHAAAKGLCGCQSRARAGRQANQHHSQEGFVHPKSQLADIAGHSARTGIFHAEFTIKLTRGRI
ncbi:hypothetical protein XAP6164_3520001 [Xanthomonas phaseoli pv. phaseoli]|nr:hypothetical protein XAP6164_3520001 [Xanthomonas phaseoli pv. phaseoli]